MDGLCILRLHKPARVRFIRRRDTRDVTSLASLKFLVKLCNGISLLNPETLNSSLSDQCPDQIATRDNHVCSGKVFGA